MFKKICQCCGKEFESKTPQAMYCKGPHYLPCPVCGKPVLKSDNDFSRPPKCCSSECSHKLRSSKFKTKQCVLCGKEFTPKSGVQIICEDDHYATCEICGNQYIIDKAHVHDNITTCSEACSKEKTRRNNLKKYGCEHPMQNKEVQEHFHQAMKKKYGVEHALQIPGKMAQQQRSAYYTNMTRNGVPYACMLPQCMAAQGKVVSSYNVKFGKLLKENGIPYSFEKRIEKFSYDICVEDCKTLIEIDPTYTHQATPNHWGVARDENYHLNKTDLAEKQGYRCIHVFDWDDWGRIVDLIKPRSHKVYARKCEVYRLHKSVGDEFLNKYHLQGTCRGQLLYLGLVFEGELVQVMTFGKSRYDRSFSVELMRMCSHPDYEVVGGASKLFSYATSEYGLSSIISYCDRSKFTGSVYEKIGMKLLRVTPPQEVWSFEEKKITANLLRARGYDQLFGTSYGKGTSNEELMLMNGWLPIFDCGQRVYGFK